MIKIKLEDSHISVNDECKTKKSILEKISELLSEPSGVNSNEIFKKLYEREKLYYYYVKVSTFGRWSINLL